MTNYTSKEIREGKERLKNWVPKLRKKIDLKDIGNRLEPKSGVGTILANIIKTKNLESLIVYEIKGKGWYADVVLRHLPPGYDNVLGTPEDMPHPTKEDALRDGKIILERILKTCIENEMAYREIKTPLNRYFKIFGNEITIPEKLFESALDVRKEIGVNQIGIEIHENRLLSQLEKIMEKPNTFDLDMWEKASDRQKAEVMASILGLITLGRTRID